MLTTQKILPKKQKSLEKSKSMEKPKSIEKPRP